MSSGRDFLTLQIDSELVTRFMSWMVFDSIWQEQRLFTGNHA